MAEIYDFDEINEIRERNNRKKLKKRKRFFAVLFVIAACGLIFLTCGIYADKRVLNFDIKTFSQSVFNNMTGNGINESQKIVSDEGTAFYEFNDYIVQCKGSEITFYDINFRKTATKNVTLKSPVARVSGDYMAVADLHGKTLFLFKGTNISKEIDLQKGIINFDVSQDGYISVISDSQQGKNEAVVYNENGDSLFTHIFKDNFALSVKYNSGNKLLYANEIDTTGSETGTIFEAFKAGEDKAVFSLSKAGHVYPFWGFFSDGNIYCYGEQSFLTFDKNGKELWNTEFKNSIYGCTVASDKYPVIADAGVSDKDNKMKVYVKDYDESGKQKSSYEYEGNVKGINSADGLICLNTGYEVLFLSSSGSLKGKVSSDTEILDVLSVKNNTVVLKIKNGIMISEK